MKKVLVSLFLFCEFTSPCFSKSYKLNASGGLLLKPRSERYVNSENSVTVSDKDFILMSPVKLSNPEKVDYNFNAGLPLYYGDTSSNVVKPKIVKKVAKVEKVSTVETSEPVIVKTDVEKPVEIKAETIETIPVKESEPVVAENKISEVKTDEKRDEKSDAVSEELQKQKIEEAMVVKTEEVKSVDTVENASVVAEQSAVKTDGVVDNAGDSAVVEENVASQIDKNVDEARKLLEIAERLAVFVANDEVFNRKSNDVFVESLDDKRDAVIDEVKAELEKKDVPVVNENAPKSLIKLNTENLANFSVRFAKDDEKLGDDDVKKLIGVAEQLAGNNDVNVKIISYYSNLADRNVAFSRLLNTRKILLEKNMPTSQIMIMVLEDKTKADMVDVLFE